MNGRFSPRLILGGALITLVVLVVIVGRLASHGRTEPLAIPGESAATAASAPKQGDPALSTSAPVDPLLHKPAPPSTPPGSATPEEVAKAFALAWLHHDGINAQQWLDSMTPYASADLRSQLEGVDPGSVPASRLAKPISIDNDTATDCVAQAVTDNGLLKLSLQLSSGRWLVTDVDWDPS